jgi:predicted Co/Zn/Cd cation transporter (cation efflux family)
MVTRARRLVAACLLAASAVLTLVAFAVPAGAQQLVDAGKEKQGGLAFVLMAVMFFAIFAVLFTMDRVRRRRSQEEEQPQR